jgi:hypothetical protein
MRSQPRNGRSPRTCTGTVPRRSRSISSSPAWFQSTLYFLKIEYRGVVAHLADHPALELKTIPYFTTIEKAGQESAGQRAGPTNSGLDLRALLLHALSS